MEVSKKSIGGEKMLKKVILISIIVLVLVLIGLSCARQEKSSPPSNSQSGQTTELGQTADSGQAILTTSEFREKYSKGEYHGKIFQVSGIVASTLNGEFGLASSLSDMHLIRSFVMCRVKDAQQETLARKEIVIKGKFTGWDSFGRPILDDCTIVSIK